MVAAGKEVSYRQNLSSKYYEFEKGQNEFYTVRHVQIVLCASYKNEKNIRVRW